MTTLQIVGLVLFCVLLVQWGLAFYCLMRLYKIKPRRLKSVKWNIIILAGIIVGPVCYLILERKPKKEQNGGDYSI